MLFKKLFKKQINTLLNYSFAFYKVALRPTFGNACKFYPTCSCYSHQAYKKYGFLVGTALTFYRLLRCHPFSSGGYDPVPELQEAQNGRK